MINKNTRPFAGVEGGLLAVKLGQLIDSKSLNSIVVSTNDEACISIAEDFQKLDDRINIIRRPDELCLSTTNLVDLIKYVPQIVKDDHILWTHVTTPFVEGADYDEIISHYSRVLNEGHDSLMTCMELKNYLFDENAKLINGTEGEWPRTQDLDPVYELNHAVFLASRQIYLSMNNRLGQSPYIHVMHQLKSLDIDWEDDFVIAEAIYEKLK